MGSYLSSPPKTDSKITGQVIIVTGANRGIGFATAKSLYNLGATVYLGCRTEDGANKAIERIRAEVTGSEGQLKWLPFDLSTVTKAQESARGFLKIENRLDVLVNNAALGDLTFGVNEDGIENNMAINHIGHFAFTTILLDLMKQTSSKAGSDVRIVVVSSMAHDLWNKNPVSFSEISDLQTPFPVKDYDTWTNQLTRYGRSKLANILFASELQRRLDAEGSNIIVVSLHPGAIATESALNLVSRMPILGPISHLFAGLFLEDVADGGRHEVFAAANPVVRAESEKYKGKYMVPVGKITAPSALAQDLELSTQLWALTERIVQEKGGA